MQEPAIPGSYHTSVTLIRRLQEADPGAGRKALKRRMMYQLGLPPETDDPYWDECEFSNQRSNRTRRQLIEDRFNAAMHKI